MQEAYNTKSNVIGLRVGGSEIPPDQGREYLLGIARKLLDSGNKPDQIWRGLYGTSQQNLQQPWTEEEIDELLNEARKEIGKDDYYGVSKQRYKPSEYEMTVEILKTSGLNQGIAYSGGTFRKYGAGVWQSVHDLEVRRDVSRSIEAWRDMWDVQHTRALENNITDLIKSEKYEREEIWNANPNIIVFRNCALDTDTMRRIEHSPAHKATVGLPYDYDPAATAPVWKRVIRDLLGEEEREFFQEFAGYCATTDVRQQITLWLVGPPGGGKSTLIAGLEAMLGDLAGTLGLSQLQSNGAKFALANIPGKTLLTCTENPKGHIKASDTLNALITGDTLQIERKYRDAVEYRNTAKLVWALNTLPALLDANNGLFRRVKVMDVPAIPARKRDNTILDKIRDEGPGIMVWALEGLQRLRERGHFDYPDSVKAATDRFQRGNDLQAEFLEERCQRAPEQLFYTSDYSVKASDLTQAFNDWAVANGHREWSSHALANEWWRLGLKRSDDEGAPKRKNDGRRWYGVRCAG